MLTERQIARLLDLANLACQKGMIGEGRSIFQAVLAIRPGFAPALVGLAFSHIVVDDFDGALTLLDKVLAANAADADALAMRGLACMLAGRREEAEQAFAGIPQDCAAAAMARAVMEVA
ncbi:tetratricopeptide repeat protein [uncultured Desulfovibrio sp.]|uniref:tetratricopeptide repeat protein n=1 Tax=uncultured Desulfovibrio sp. TaxID=167968 RepID=UPI002629D1A3|nr:tetratricopeptide repeat protein [uncultured Desulfovibrio sp.]